ncbi:MAG: YcaO-like family protein [Pseudomonadota bacterium]
MNEQSRAFFRNCLSVLNGSGETVRDSAVFGFLKDIGYIEAGAINQEVLENRSAIINLYLRFDDAFQLPVRGAPGASFWGGMISLDQFGLGEHGKRSVGVGGKGAGLKQAFESCAGEAAEFLSFLRRSSDNRVLDTVAEHHLSAEEFQWVEKSVEPERLKECGWVRAETISDSTHVFFPADLVLRDVSGGFSIESRTESTGVGAGVTKAHAINSGFLEVIERDAVAMWWFGGAGGYRLPNAFLEKSGIAAFVSRVRKGVTRPWWMLDITADNAVPAVVSLSSDPDGQGVVAGSSAGFSFLHAAQSAFLEMCQMEFAREISLYRNENKEKHELNEIDRLWLDRSERLHLDKYPELFGDLMDYKGLKVQETNLEKSIRKLSDNNFTPYVCELTQKDISIPVFKTIIPKMQSSKPHIITDRLVEMAYNRRTNLNESVKKPTII